MHACYVPPSQIADGVIHISDAERHHLIHVCRLRTGDSVMVFDGEGNNYTARLDDVRAPVLKARILRRCFIPKAPPYITLFQGLPKFDKMDVIVQKTTELGVDRVLPVICERSIPKPGEAAQKKRIERWRRIADEAAKQCKRPRLAKVLPPQDFASCLERVAELDLSILLWEAVPLAKGDHGESGETRQSIKRVLREHGTAESVGIFVGPEGGFSPREVELAIQKGCLPATIGNNILRTETAAIVGTALVMYELGDRRGNEKVLR